ncbi:hypothetical protein J6590_017662 [Homalodisca vitripennis]|nr:hypothetical protein J6590_017662 [Homalodisca vitripennis]
MALCGVCGIVCNDASSTKCTTCENSFHLHCVKTESEEKIERNTTDWKCASCKGKSSTLGSVKSNISTSDPLAKDFLINVMESLKKRVNNIEISGVPQSRGENITDLLTDVGAALGVEVKETDVAAAHRVPSYRTDREPSVIVQFTARRIKEQWMAGFRQRKSDSPRHQPALPSSTCVCQRPSLAGKQAVPLQTEAKGPRTRLKVHLVPIRKVFRQESRGLASEEDQLL